MSFRQFALHRKCLGGGKRDPQFHSFHGCVYCSCSGRPGFKKLNCVQLRRLPLRLWQNRDTTKATRKSKNKTFANQVAAPAMPPKPKSAATMATMRKINVQFSMAALHCLTCFCWLVPGPASDRAPRKTSSSSAAISRGDLWSLLSIRRSISVSPPFAQTRSSFVSSGYCLLSRSLTRFQNPLECGPFIRGALIGFFVGDGSSSVYVAYSSGYRAMVVRPRPASDD